VLWGTERSGCTSLFTRASVGYGLSRITWRICGAAPKLHRVAAEPVGALVLQPTGTD
jgi:hypothetical protein